MGAQKVKYFWIWKLVRAVARVVLCVDRLERKGGKNGKAKKDVSA